MVPVFVCGYFKDGLGLRSVLFLVLFANGVPSWYIPACLCGPTPLRMDIDSGPLMVVQIPAKGGTFKRHKRHKKYREFNRDFISTF